MSGVTSRRRTTMDGTRFWPAVAGVLLAAGAAAAQDEEDGRPVPPPPPPPTSRRPVSVDQRLRALEDRVAELESQATARDEEARGDLAGAFSDGIVTVGGLRFRLGGAIKASLVDPQSQRDPVLGTTESPDPHFVFEKFSLVPQVDFLRSREIGSFSTRAQVDFHVTRGDTLLKRATLDHEIRPVWWFTSHEKIGIDDRFIRPERRLTQNYPLTGTAFWSGQEAGFFWEATLGSARGRPVAVRGAPVTAGTAEAPDPDRLTREMLERSEGIYLDPPYVPEASTAQRERTPTRSAQTTSTTHAPFDFAANPGALRLDFSITDGAALDARSIDLERDAFDDVLQDGRTTDRALSARELGFGAGYGRDFRELGEIDVLGFYYDDEMGDDDVAFLQSPSGLNLFNSVGVFQGRGYGFSNKRTRERVGVNGNYHFEAYHLYHALGRDESLLPRRGDGLYLAYEWIAATDGDLDRTGWYAQASYRFSNPYWRRFLITFEPVVRYGELRGDIAHIPSLPLTWNRRQWVVGTVFGIVRGVFLRAEYAFNDETTGGGKVANDELLIQLLAIF